MISRDRNSLFWTRAGWRSSCFQVVIPRQRLSLRFYCRFAETEDTVPEPLVTPLSFRPRLGAALLCGLLQLSAASLGQLRV